MFKHTACPANACSLTSFLGKKVRALQQHKSLRMWHWHLCGKLWHSCLSFLSFLTFMPDLWQKKKNRLPAAKQSEKHTVCRNSITLTKEFKTQQRSMRSTNSSVSHYQRIEQMKAAVHLWHGVQLGCVVSCLSYPLQSILLREIHGFVVTGATFFPYLWVAGCTKCFAGESKARNRCERRASCFCMILPVLKKKNVSSWMEQANFSCNFSPSSGHLVLWRSGPTAYCRNLCQTLFSRQSMHWYRSNAVYLLFFSSSSLWCHEKGKVCAKQHF